MTATERWSVRLKRCREALGLTRTDLAAALFLLGPTDQGDSIRMYEEGQATPRIETFGALAQVLGVSMETLIYGEEEAARIADERDDASADGSTVP